MSGERTEQQAIGVAAVRQVATLMAAAAITAPKSGGQLFLAGKPPFLETVIIDNPQIRTELAGWLRARGKERREAIWFRDADVAEAVDAILFIGLAPNWYPPNYDCGACGYATCAEFLHASKELRNDSAELEFTGPTCNLRDIDLGIAVGSAAKTAAFVSSMYVVISPIMSRTWGNWSVLTISVARLASPATNSSFDWSRSDVCTPVNAFELISQIRLTRS